MRKYFRFYLTSLAVILIFSGCLYQIELDPKIEINNAPRALGHNERFLEVLDLSNVDYIAIGEVQNGSMGKVSRALLRKQISVLDPANLMFGYVYTTNVGSPSIYIEKSNTHAFSIISLDKDWFTHAYYEKKSDGSFHQVLSLVAPSTSVGGQDI